MVTELETAVVAGRVRGVAFPLCSASEWDGSQILASATGLRLPVMRIASSLSALICSMACCSVRVAEFIFHDPVASELMPTVDRLFADFSSSFSLTAAMRSSRRAGVPIPWDGTVEGRPAGWTARRAAVDAHETGSSDAPCDGHEVVQADRAAASAASSCRPSATSERSGPRNDGRPRASDLKQGYPLVLIQRYARWKRDDGSPLIRGPHALAMERKSSPWSRVRCGLSGQFRMAAVDRDDVPGERRVRRPRSPEHVLHRPRLLSGHLRRAAIWMRTQTKGPPSGGLFLGCVTTPTSRTCTVTPWGYRASEYEYGLMFGT